MIRNNILFLLITVLFTFNTNQVFSQNNSECRTPPKGPRGPIDKLNQSVQEVLEGDSDPEPLIDWWSATEEMVKNRTCKLAIPTIAEIENDINLKGNSKTRASATFHSVSFEDESPELIEAFKNLTVKKDIFGKDASTVDLQLDYQINPECKKVKCAVEKIFGNELGDKLLFMNYKYGFNGSELAFDSASRLSLDEVNSLISGVQTYPASRFPLDSNKQLTKFKRGYTLAVHDGSTVAYAAIAFYDSWTNQTNVMKEYTAFHELGHYIGSELNLDENRAWLDLSGWEEKDKVWTATKPNSFTSKYGATNPSEDFAESITAYRYNPQLLKKINPDKYLFIKELVFDGMEYTEDTLCNKTQSTMLKLAKSSPEDNKVRTTDELKNLFKVCGTETRTYLLDRKNAEEGLISCLNKSKNISSMVMAVDKTDPPFKYSSLVKEGLLKQKQLPDEIQNNSDHFDDAKAYLKENLITDILDWDKRRYYNYSGNDGMAICKKNWNDYGYQAVFARDEGMKKVVNPYDASEGFNKFFTDLCEKIQKSKTTPKPFTRVEVEKALEEN